MSSKKDLYKVIEELGSKKIKVSEAQKYLDFIIENKYLKEVYTDQKDITPLEKSIIKMYPRGKIEININKIVDEINIKNPEILESNINILKKKNIRKTNNNLDVIEIILPKVLFKVDFFKLKEKLKQTEKEYNKLKKELDNKGKYKRSGHLQDQLLKYTYPKDNTPDLFSVLNEETIQEIEAKGVERSKVVEGIKLSPAETKVIDTLCKLLHENSQNLEPKNQLYYTGNKKPEIINYGEETAIAPQLGLTLYDFTKEYIGIDKKVGGKDIKNVSNILKGLSKKEFLIRYKEEVKEKGGGKRVRELEVFNKIISLPTLKEKVYNKEEIEISKTEETIIVLHPIFRSQIDSKFIVYPNDITQRTILAYGSPNVSQITLRLRDYLLTELSSKHYYPEIKQERLYYKLNDKWMRESRKSNVKKYTEKALQVVKDIGLLESYKIEPAKTTGEPKYIFKLNKKFE